MKKIISRIRDCFEDKLRGICSLMGPHRRVITIVVLIVVFAAVNIYVTFRAIYNIGRDDVNRKVIEITPIDVPDFELQHEKPTQLQKEMEDFFKQNFKSEQDERTEE